MVKPARLLVQALSLLLLLLVVVLGITSFVARPWSVAGRSMQPTLSPGDRVVVDLWTYRQRSPRPGEIVLFLGPGPNAAWLIKRCVEPPQGPANRFDPHLWAGVPDPGGSGSWLVGDRAVESWDSRTFGSVPRQRLLGRVVWRYWPPSRAGRVR